MSIAAAVTLALNDPDQPATLRTRKRRERRAPRPPANRPRHASRPTPVSTPTAGPLLTPGGGRRPAQTQAPAPPGGLATAAAPTVEVAGLSDYWVPARRVSVWVRIRSGFVLTVLLAVLGALVAAAVAGFVIFVALAVRSAVG